MNPERIEEIRAAAAGATPGPWRSYADYHTDITDERYVLWSVLFGDDLRDTVATLGDDEQSDADATFIALSRSAIPELLEALEAAENAIKNHLTWGQYQFSLFGPERMRAEGMQS